jgi:hypothetical protein
MTNEQILDELVAADGAILNWQVSDSDAFKAAHAAGLIRLDVNSDCYVHPQAIETVPGEGWTIPTGVATKRCYASAAKQNPEGWRDVDGVALPPITWAEG